MSLHGLLSVTIGVPNVAETAAYYADFGLAAEGDGSPPGTAGGLHRLRPVGGHDGARGDPRRPVSRLDAVFGAGPAQRLRLGCCGCG